MHPEIALLPLLMIADYMLTIYGQKQSLRVYRNHFVVDTYELNPRWREDVERQRWFNPRHLTTVFVATAAIFTLDYLLVEEWPIELGFALLVGVWAAIIGSHLTNALIFHYVNRNPEIVSGEVRLSHRFVTRISQFTYIGFALPTLAAAAVAPSLYTAGIAGGVLLLPIVHIGWGKSPRKASSSEDESQF